jgi:hypothetical protein
MGIGLPDLDPRPTHWLPFAIEHPAREMDELSFGAT